ncbi:MAG TPA: IPT/TIG domain-containing protein [Geobacteraceae bacterium]
MGNIRGMGLRCNGKIVVQFIAIVCTCLLLNFVIPVELHAAKNYTITATAGSGGTISPSGSVSVSSGSSKTFTVTPNTGYHVANVTVDGVSQGAITSYTFTNVTANHTISATFAINTYTITATAGSGGTITPSSATVNYGGSQTFTITPNTGYSIAGVTVDGVSQGAITSYTFTNVTANHTISATFAIAYTITATAGSGGAISPSGAVAVNSGGNQSFTITPNTGYTIAGVTVDGVPQGAITSYTLTNVTANHTITVSFAINTPPPSSSSPNYFYDDLGRLARVVQGTSGVIYNYDELGNLVSTTSATTAGGAPTLTAINPNVLFVGSKMLVSITGQNLLTTDTVTADGGLVAINNIAVADTLITAEMTALSAGSDTIKVTTRSGGTATVSVTLSSSTLAVSPGQLALAPGANGTLTATISPAIGTPLTISLYNSSPTTATVPQTVTIPASGSASFAVNTLQTGACTIDAGGAKAVVIVTSPFTGDVNGLAAGRISVSIDAPSGTSPSTARAVSVSIDAPSGSSPSVANPVSVTVDAPAGTSPAIAGGVSVQIQ